MKKLLAVLLAVITVGCVFVACSKADNKKETTTKSESTSFTVQNPTDKAKIKDKDAIDFIKNDIRTSELLEAVKPSVAILLDIHNLTIELKQDCIIHCDKRWTTEALTNIIKNAIEYSPDGSEIEIDSGENPMYSWISVKDSGMGMDKTEYAALFKRFENSTNENGFGIGMPLALSILKGQGGDIDVDFGGRGEGTTFILKFFK